MKTAKVLVRSALRQVEETEHPRSPRVQSNLRRELQECHEDLDQAYEALGRKLRGTIPQDARRYMDRYMDDLERLIHRTEQSQVSPYDSDRESLRSFGSHLNPSNVSKSSSTSSKRVLLAARLASLQAEIKAKKLEDLRKSELKRLETEELEYQAQMKADRAKQNAEENTRRAKVRAEIDVKHQELEDQKLLTELMKTETELHVLEQAEGSPNQSVISLQRTPALNGNANPFAPSQQPAQGRTATVVQPEESSMVSLLKAVTDSLSINRLPAPEPPDFGGDPLKYPSWRGSFTTLIESRQIPAAEKLYYMRRYLRGEAKEAVEGLFYLSTEEAYDSAMKILDDRFGNPFIISETFRDKLESWPKIAINDTKGLRRLADFLRQCLVAMHVAGRRPENPK